jgi:hypothetical protein
MLDCKIETQIGRGHFEKRKDAQLMGMAFQEDV